MEKGKIRTGYIILCGRCWEKADIAIQMAEMVRNQTASSGYDMPDFLQDLFNKKSK